LFIVSPHGKLHDSYLLIEDLKILTDQHWLFKWEGVKTHLGALESRRQELGIKIQLQSRRPGAVDKVHKNVILSGMSVLPPSNYRIQ
jgi:hypothetical protein